MTARAPVPSLTNDHNGDIIKSTTADPPGQSAGESEEIMKKHIMEYKSGDSRMSPGTSVDYMLVKVDDIELYAEAIAQDDESATYDELKASIIEQARKHGIDANSLIFWYD
jgi:hypothetical protein